VAERFVTPEHRDLIIASGEPRALLSAMERWLPPERPKWMDTDGATGGPQAGRVGNAR
jgi:hypothetical protein